MRQTRLSHGPRKQDEAPAPRAPARPAAMPFGDAMSLQRSIGNAAVGQLMNARERASGEVATPIDSLTQTRISEQIGHGQTMGAPLEAEMGRIVNAPLGGVRVHRDTVSDA